MWGELLLRQMEGSPERWGQAGAAMCRTGEPSARARPRRNGKDTGLGAFSAWCGGHGADRTNPCRGGSWWGAAKVQAPPAWPSEGTWHLGKP